MIVELGSALYAYQNAIFQFGWSTDGKQLAVARGTQINDVVLISNFK